MKEIERNLQEIGKSFLITLPKTWVQNLNLGKGSKVKMLVDDNGELIIAPVMKEEQTESIAVIKFDDHYRRNFFREYFEGASKIIFNLEKELTEEDRKDLYSFLKRFMGVEVINETSDKIELKSFKINELTIEECLNRVHFLTLTMFDEVLSNNNKLKLNEIEGTLTKFYYQIVMLIRRFLSEGKYATSKEMTLIRAMDYRMVAERIERIADILKDCTNSELNNFTKELEEVKSYYVASINGFINSNYSKVSKLLFEERVLKKKFFGRLKRAKSSNNIEEYVSMLNIVQIIRLSREISMLVR